MRILWLKTELLHPIDKGGKIRSYEMLRELKKNHHITYLTLDDGSADTDALVKSSEYAHAVITIPHKTAPKFSLKFYIELFINLTSALPYFMQKYVSNAMLQEVEKLVKSQNFDIVVCDFLMPAVNVPKQMEMPTLLFQHNVEAMIWRRHFEVQQNAFKKIFFKKQWQKAIAYERAACQNFDYVAAVSSVDANIMREEYALKQVADVPTGVDTEFFQARNDLEKDAFNLVFTGSMDWLPNEDAMCWFITDIYPLVKRHIPAVTLTIVGRNPFPLLIESSQNDPSILVTGRVPDVRPFMQKASVYIVPMRIGSGTRLKIYEAMSMALPMVSTRVGAEGLPIIDGEELFLRDTPEEFAEMVVNLLSDKALAQRVGQNAAKTVHDKFGWKKVADDFIELCDRAINVKATQG
ncbi:MAG: glycosyltransferase [Methylococcales bacterium]